MPTGTFVRTGTGTQNDPYRPDLSSLETSRVKPVFLKLLSESDGNMTCEYKLRDKSLAEINEEKMKAAAITSVIADIRAAADAMASGSLVETQKEGVVKALRVIAKQLEFTREESIN